MAIGIEKADDPLGLLKRLDELVLAKCGQNTDTKTNAVHVMLVQGVHGRLPLIRSQCHSPPSYRLAPALNLGNIKGEALG